MWGGGRCGVGVGYAVDSGRTHTFFSFFGGPGVLGLCTGTGVEGRESERSRHATALNWHSSTSSFIISSSMSSLKLLQKKSKRNIIF